MTFTRRLRARTREGFTHCPMCGQATGSSTREVARLLGVSHNSIARFMRGQAPSAHLIDRLVWWLDAREESNRAEEG